LLNPSEVSYSHYTGIEEFKDFQCEKSDYSDFVKNPNEATKYHNDRLGVTYVFKLQNQPIGFVTLAMSSLRKDKLPPERKEQKPFRDIPSLLLGHIARDTRYKGKGVGKIIIDFTLSLAFKLGEEVGCRFVILDAEDDVVDHYNKHYGFQPIPKSKIDKTTLMFFDLGLRNNPTTVNSQPQTVNPTLT